MDSIDLKILNALKKNSRTTTSEISKSVNLSIPAVGERIRKLEEASVIEQYTIKINREKTNKKLMALIFINIDKTENIQGFRESIVKFHQVLECHHIAGEYDYLIKVLLEDSKELENFITFSLKKIKGVGRSNTIIVLSSLKENINV